jgi:flavin-dependent dehydrogenase
LRQRGLDVIVADSLIPPIDKACGEGLMPDSRRDLLRLGIQLSGGHRFSGIQFANRTTSREDLATAEFSAGEGLGVRRVELHRQLTKRAASIGVRLLWGCRVDLGDARTSGNRVDVGGEAFSYGYLVGADGEASRVRRWVGLERGSVRSQRIGFRRHYRVAPWSDAVVEVHWGDQGEAYVTPVAEDEVCVAAITNWSMLRFDSILEGLPYLHSKLRGRAIVGRDRGSMTTTRKLHRVTSGNVALWVTHRDRPTRLPAPDSHRHSVRPYSWPTR